MEVDEGAAASAGPSAAPAATSSSTAPAGTSSSSSVVAASSGAAAESVSVSLHPLVIMNISEHWTRTKAQRGAATNDVFGAIIGRQSGRNIEIMNSFELDFQRIDNQVVIDRDYYDLKESQFKQVFSDMDFLGWYTTGEGPSEEEISIQRQICEINESPLFLQLNPAARNTDLPITMYESVIDLVGGNARMLFVKLKYTLATEEAERIGLDHMARITGGSGGTKGEDDDSAVATQSKVADHVIVQHSAIKMLASRVRLILDYVKAVEAGELPHNHEVMREAKALAARLPVLEADRFRPEFYTQCNDAALLTYLGVVMKSCNNMNQFINKFGVLHQRPGGSRRMRGLFF